MKLGRLLLMYIIIAVTFVVLLPLLGTCSAPTVSADGPTIKVLAPDGSEQEVLLEDYLVGVVAAEMPAAFEEEALEAQAIAARTFIYRNSPSPLGDGGRHGEVSVCSDSTHCQAYNDQSTREEKWQDQSKKYEKKIRQAVKDTFGQVVTVDGQVVNTPYFAVCGGHTANSTDVWGGDNSWLVSVDCTWDTEAPKYRSEVILSVDEAAQKLGVSEQAVREMSITSHFADGRVKQVRAGDKEISGTEMRSLLGLNSTTFSWQIRDEQIVIAVRGYGHGVGLCQYGANGMAKSGYTATQIIEHYYSGATVTKEY